MVFEHSDYRKWLAGEISQRIEDNPMYSANAFSKKVGLSQSYLSLVLNGKRKLTPKSARTLAGKLQLSETETDYLLLLVKKQNAPDRKVAEVYSREIRSLKKKNSIGNLDIEVFKVISDWHYSAVLEAVNLDDVTHTPAGIAAKLDLPKDLVADALDKLCRLKLIEKKAGHYRRLDMGFISTPSEIFSKGLRSFHKQVLRKAVLAVDDQPIEERSVSGITIALDPKKIPEAKKKIERFQQELMEFLEDGEKTEVYQLSTQLFKL